jgi:DNA invertase Pin-like site-specific DNA recombinase
MGSQKVVLYVRSATFKKPEEDNSVDMQLRKLREYACKHNYEILAEFMDEGANGNRINHPGLNSMLNMASNDRDMIDAILIVDNNRLTRKKGLFFWLQGWLYENRIDIVSICAPREISSRPAEEDTVRQMLWNLMNSYD